MAGVLLENVTKRYGEVEVIRALRLEVRDEEFMVLVGPSGCGKSTLLRMIAGLEEITAGAISIGHRVVNDVPPKNRDIAMVFQSYALYPHMTVRENLDFGLRLKKIDPTEIDRRVTDAARLLGIEPYLDRKPRQLSGGQRQRVAVGRAIVRQPAVYLFDEPLSNLDAKLRVQMRAEITALQRRLRTTTVYVTHDQVEAMTMGDRIAVLNEGALQQVGTPLELYDRPVNLFVAQFIGTPPMSFLSGRIGADGASVRGHGFALPLSGALRATAAGLAGQEVQVGVRPEHLGDAVRASDGPTTVITLPIALVEPLGHEIIVHGRLGENPVAAKVAPRRRPAIGTAMELQLALDHLHLFDAASGRRLGGRD